MTRSSLSRHSLGRAWLHLWDWLVIWGIDMLLVLVIIVIAVAVQVAHWWK